ncbi:MAG: two-component system OmpR family response regulator [Hyphomonadaceae bacterium]|jgi:two-component system OmpR family response regulator|nr:MAG: two-component system OmpR family response regulator [Hyphomonadaceae bacterium]KAF0183849.1 MAG: two-component system OmpR family response regulator [Hyphomonadaceae bacterium]
MQVLIVEDAVDTSKFMARALEEAGHQTQVAHNGVEGENLARSLNFDVLVFDRMLPLKDGMKVVEDLRADGINTPVLFLSALGDVEHRIEGLKAGGDDYLSKPYSSAELVARVEVLGKRVDPDNRTTLLKLGDLEMDLITRKVRRASKKIDIQPREFRLLEYLMRNAGQIVTRTMLLEKVWDYHFDPQTNVIDVHISRLRTKIDKEFDHPMLHTVRGTGYRLEA